MAHPDPGLLTTAVVLTIIFTAGAIIPISIVRIQNRAKMKAIEVLKAYADRGEEPPASVVDALGRVNVAGPVPPPGPPRRPTRADHLAHFAGSVGLAMGAGAVIWWRAPLEYEHPGGLLITAVVVAIFFAASAAARLVGAITAGDGG